MTELTDLLSALARKAPKAKAKPKARKPRAEPRPTVMIPSDNGDVVERDPRLYSDRWKVEQLVYFVRETTCRCGATSRQTHPHPLIRRYHPQYGIHEEAALIAHNSIKLSTMPVVMEVIKTPLQNCHECLSPVDTENPFANQRDLFAAEEMPEYGILRKTNDSALLTALNRLGGL